MHRAKILIFGATGLRDPLGVVSLRLLPDFAFHAADVPFE
jgi:hypothetical protein